MRITVDSTILVHYADQGDPVRQHSAMAIHDALIGLDCALTYQAVREFAAVSLRKRIATPRQITDQLRRWSRVFPFMPAAGMPELERALQAREEGRFSFRHAMLLATAASAGCEVVISEDMGHDATLDRVRVVGAFNGQGGVSAAARAVLGMAA